LERLNATVDWEIFRPDLERIDQKVRKSAAGCKPTCRVLMFKLLILQRLYGLSDERLEYQVRDRLSFMRFLKLGLDGKIPDARTVWAFREALKRHRLAEVYLNDSIRLRRVEWLIRSKVLPFTRVTAPVRGAA